MKLCFNGATTRDNATLKEDLAYCEKHGYDFIEIRTEDKLPEYLKSHTLADLNQFFTESRLKPLALNALVFFNNLGEAAYKEMMKQFQEMLHVAEQLNIPYIVAVPLITKQPLLREEIRKSCVETLSTLAEEAQQSKVKIALEFVGHPDCTVNTFADACRIIEDVNRENVGLVFDCFHFHAMGSNLEDLQQADGEKIFIVHIDDTDDFPVGALRDEHRVWPGEGAIDLASQFTALTATGFSGPVSVELFRPEYYQLPAEETIRKARETTLRVLKSTLSHF